MREQFARAKTASWRGRWALFAAALTALSGCRLTVPMSPDRPAFEQFAAPTQPGTPVRMLPLRMGYQWAPRCAAAGETSCRTAVQIVHAAYLVEHPRATFLIESALSSHADEDMARFSLIDRQTLDYVPEASLGEWMQRLRVAGWAPPGFVLLTHAHWDHASGLVDLDHPRVLMGPGEAEFVRAFPADKPPAVMPVHFAQARLETFAWDGPPYENFPASHDLFGDGAIVLVPLAGHTPGSLGVFVNTVRGRRVLFVGDAAWSNDAFELPSHKLAPLSKLTDHDPAHLAEALWRLHHLHRRHPEVLIVPTHSGDAFEQLRALTTTPER